jgi:hypothetical protein
MALPQIPLNGRCAGDDRRSTHGPASTRFDCSGPNRGSQARTKLQSANLCARTSPSTAFFDICYDVHVWQQVAKHVSVRNGQQFIKHVVPAFIKPARTLWNEVIGFVFICFSVVFGFKAVRLYLDFARATGDEASAHMVRFVVAAFCTFLMLWFGVTSFLRARKISRS